MTQSDVAVAQGFKMTELGPLPEDWGVASLREVTAKTRQVDPRKKPDVRFRYVDVSGVSSEDLAIRDTKDYVGKEAPSRARRLMAAGDVLFATVRPYLRRIAVVPPDLDGHVCSTAFCVIRAQTGVSDGNYLFFACSSEEFVQRVSQHQRGSSYPAVSNSDVLKEAIPLPPLAEQKAIAAVLSAVQEAKQKSDAVIEAAKALKKSLMKYLFTYGPVPVDEAERVKLKETEIGEIPEGWEVTRLGEVARIRYGLGQPPEKDADGVAMIRATNIKRGRIVPDGLVRVRRDAIPAGRDPFLQPGEIVVVRSGAYTGDVAMVTEEWRGAVAGYDLVVSTSPALDPVFCSSFLLGRKAQAYFRGQRDRSAQPHLNAAQLSDTRVPVPALPVQQGIARALCEVDSRIAAEEAHRDALRELLGSLLNNLMTGKLRAHDLEVAA